jgi:pyruvate kinase
MSRHNINAPIMALTPSVASQRKMALYRNVRPLFLSQKGDTNTVLRAAEELLIKQGVVKKGEIVVMTWGEPMGHVGATNALKIVKVGE